MARPLPLDVPVPVHLSPRVLIALEEFLADPDTADRFEAALFNSGVQEDATEDAYEAVRATLRQALTAAERRGGPRPDGVQVRRVSDSGTLVVGGVIYGHDALDSIKGSFVKCRPVVEGSVTLCRVELMDGTVACQAPALRLAGGQALAA